MNDGHDAKTVAELVKTAAGLDPTVVLSRNVPSYEVEFAALEMEEEIQLTAWDEAMLGLADARGAVTPHDADAYLGLGAELAQALVENLVREKLLAEPLPQQPSRDPWTGSPFAYLASGLARAAGFSFFDEADHRMPTRARPAKDSAAPDSPRYTLTEEGRSTLQARKRIVRFTIPARLVLWDEPLRFTRVESERKKRFGRIHRDEPLSPDQVPASFRILDEILGLPPDERVQRIGIGATVPGLRGRLVGVAPNSTPRLLGIEPGKTWEVRKLPEKMDGQLVVAGFVTSSPERLLFRTFVGTSRELRHDAFLDPVELVDTAILAPGVLTQALALAGLAAHDVAPQGGVRVLAPADEIVSLLGRGEAPSDTFVPLDHHVRDWSTAVRVRAFPADAAAPERAFFLFLGRRRPVLRASLERACLEAAAALRTYWGEPFEPPPLDRVLEELWQTRELRSILCERRLHRDLIAPYTDETAEVQHG